jgi:hypothetical protein
MRIIKLYWIGLILMIIGATLIFISIIQIVTFEKKIGNYNQMVSEGNNGDIVYIYGRMFEYGEADQFDPENATWFVELYCVKNIDFSEDNSYAYVDTHPKIYFYDYDFDSEIVRYHDEAIIKGKIIETSDTKEVRGIEVEDGSYYERMGDFYNFTLDNFVIFLIGIIIGIIGGLIAIISYMKVCKVLFPHIMKHKLQNKEFLGISLILIGLFLANFSLASIPYESSYCALLGITFFFGLVCPGIVILWKEMVKRVLFVHYNGTARQKYKLVKHKKFVYAGIFLIIAFFILSLVASTSTEDDFIIIVTIIYYFVLIIFFYGLLINSRVYSPRVEDAIINLKSINKKPKIFSLIAIIMVVVVISVPMIYMIIINEQDSRNRIDYEDWNAGSYSEGNRIEINSFLLGYKVENGKTYVLVQSVHPPGYSSYSDYEEGYYNSIVFDEDVSDELPPEGEWLTIYGTIGEINPGSRTDFISIKGEKIGEEPFQYDIIPISIMILPALILLIIFFYSFNVIRILNKYKGLNTENDDEIQILNIKKPPSTDY